MAVVLSDEQDRILADIFRLYREGRLGITSTRGRGSSGAEFVVYRAKTTAAHAAGAVQACQLCDADWNEITGETPDAINDALIEIPDDTKLYLMPDTGGHYAILVAFVCTG